MYFPNNDFFVSFHGKKVLRHHGLTCNLDTTVGSININNIYSNTGRSAFWQLLIREVESCNREFLCPIEEFPQMLSVKFEACKRELINSESYDAIGPLERT